MTAASPSAPRAESLQAIEFQSSTRAFLLQSGGGWLLMGVTLATAGVAALVIIPLLGFMYLSNQTTRFALEGDRLHMRRGIFLRSEEEIELYRVKDIRASFSLIQQYFGNGDIEILTSDATGAGPGRHKSFAIANVEGAREIREELRSRVESSRRRLGVREYDLA